MMKVLLKGWFPHWNREKVVTDQIVLLMLFWNIKQIWIKYYHTRHQDVRCAEYIFYIFFNCFHFFILSTFLFWKFGSKLLLQLFVLAVSYQYPHIQSSAFLQPNGCHSTDIGSWGGGLLTQLRRYLCIKRMSNFPMNILKICSVWAHSASHFKQKDRRMDYYTDGPTWATIELLSQIKWLK